MNALGRRGFLKALMAAPVAAPAAANEVLQKHGLGSTLGLLTSNPNDVSGPVNQPMMGSYLQEIEDEIFGKGLSDSEIIDAESDVDHLPFTIDPDLAALKSTSNTFKVSKQRARNLSKMLERRYKQKVSEWLRMRDYRV